MQLPDVHDYQMPIHSASYVQLDTVTAFSLRLKEGTPGVRVCLGARRVSTMGAYQWRVRLQVQAGQLSPI